jgi:hypothetical protein
MIGAAAALLLFMGFIRQSAAKRASAVFCLVCSNGG